MGEINVPSPEPTRAHMDDSLARAQARVRERHLFAKQQLYVIYKAAEAAGRVLDNLIEKENDVSEYWGWRDDLARWLTRDDLIDAQAEKLRAMKDLEAFARRHGKLLEAELHLLGSHSYFFIWPER